MTSDIYSKVPILKVSGTIVLQMRDPEGFEKTPSTLLHKVLGDAVADVAQVLPEAVTISVQDTGAVPQPGELGSMLDLYSDPRPRATQSQNRLEDPSIAEKVAH